MTTPMYRFDTLFGSVDIREMIAADEAEIERFRRGEVQSVTLRCGLRLSWETPRPTRWQALMVLVRYALANMKTRM